MDKDIHDKVKEARKIMEVDVKNPEASHSLSYTRGF
jgi:hypothetical protein